MPEPMMPVPLAPPDADVDPQPLAYQQGHKVKCIHPDFNQHFIKEEPRRRGEILKMIFKMKNIFHNLISANAQHFYLEPHFNKLVP